MSILIVVAKNKEFQITLYLSECQYNLKTNLPYRILLNKDLKDKTT